MLLIDLNDPNPEYDQENDENADWILSPEKRREEETVCDAALALLKAEKDS